MSDFKTVSILQKDWKKLQMHRLRYGYSNLYLFMSSIVKILDKYKPELEDMRK